MPRRPQPISLFAFLVAVLLGCEGIAHAHSVPSLTVEAVFAADHSFEIRINMDPRLFLSDNPTSLPPVEAAWYKDQSEDQRKASFAKATEYLRKAVTLMFGGQPTDWPPVVFVPMDGATNQPFTADTKEVHLLATLRGSTSAENFQLALGSTSNASLILLNSLDGEQERRPQVLFPGETSRAFALPAGAKK